MMRDVIVYTCPYENFDRKDFYLLLICTLCYFLIKLYIIFFDADCIA